VKDCCAHKSPTPLSTLSRPTLSRRGAFGLIALGAGVSLMSTLAPGVARARGHTEILLLTCMDYRLTDDTIAYMEGRGLHDKYDHIALAGASLGAITDKYPAWGQAFWSHLDVAMELHHIHKVMVIDHRDCGAYKVIFGADAVDTAEKELALHTQELHAFRDAVKQRHPEIEVELGLMALDGKVEEIA
jgi:carbonic anhydrase